VLVVHGGAWSMGTRAQLAAVAIALARHGYTAATISYRLAPKDPFPAQIYDCQAAVRWLRENAGEFKIDPTRIGGFGYSAGGHLVALLGTLGDDDFREGGVPADAPSARLQAVVAGGTPCDFRGLPANSRRLAYWLGGTPSDKPDAYRFASPAAFITADDPPMFFFHGERDRLVPIHSPRRMVESLAVAGVEAKLHTIHNTGHIGALFDPETLAMALAFADRNLKSQFESAPGNGPTRVEGDEVGGGTSDGQ
jgi:acetyl esterase/lipase